MAKHIFEILLIIFAIYSICIYINKDNEINKLNNQIKTIQTERDELKVEIENLSNDLLLLESNIIEKDKELEDANNKIKSLNNNVNKLKASKNNSRSTTVAYNNISRGGYTRGTRSLSQADIDLIAKVLYLEAGNQSNEGQRAVVEVILNRVDSNHHSFPNSVYEVIYRKGQFSTVPMIASTSVREKELQNIQAVLGGARVLPNNDYVYFATSKINGRNFIKIGDHWFSSL